MYGLEDTSYGFHCPIHNNRLGLLNTVGISEDHVFFTIYEFISDFHLSAIRFYILSLSHSLYTLLLFNNRGSHLMEEQLSKRTPIPFHTQLSIHIAVPI